MTTKITSNNVLAGNLLAGMTDAEIRASLQRNIQELRQMESQAIASGQNQQGHSASELKQMAAKFEQILSW